MEPNLQQQIDTIFKDFFKGLATKDEFKQGVQDVVAAEFEHQAADPESYLARSQKEVEQLTLTVKDLTDQVKFLRRSRFDALKDADGRYRGIWPSAEHAKHFGLYIMSDVLKIEWAQKAFDALGYERRAIVDGEIKAITSSDITEGAVLAPSEFIPKLVELIEAFSAYRQLAQEHPMGAGDGSIPVLTSDITVYCPAAGVAATEGTLGFKALGLNPLEWVAYAAVNRDLDEDAAIAVGEIVARSLARAFGNKEDACGFVGDGTKAYFNVVGARAALRAVDATITNCKGLKVQDTAGVWSAIDLQDLLAVAGLLPQYAEIGGGPVSEVAWVTHKNFYLTVMLNAALTAGGAYAAEVTRPDYLVSPTFLGRPVKFGGGMPSVIEADDHCPLLYGNWKLGSALGDRRKLTIEQSTEVLFLQRQRVIMGSERIAINNHGVGSTTAAGPLVGLWADIA